jgi:hypothetical protein
VKNFSRIRIALQRSQSHPLPMQRFDCTYKASKCNGTAKHSTAQHSMRDFSSWYSATVHICTARPRTPPWCCTRSLALRVLTIVRL